MFSRFFRSVFSHCSFVHFGVSSYSLLSTLFQFCHTIHHVLKHTLGSFLQFLLFLCLDHSGLHSLFYHVIPLIGPNYARPDETPPALDERILILETRQASDEKLLNLSRVFGGVLRGSCSALFKYQPSVRGSGKGTSFLYTSSHFTEIKFRRPGNIRGDLPCCRCSLGALATQINP